MAANQSSFLFDFVDRYDAVEVKAWMESLGYFPFYTVTGYVAVIFAVREFMKTRQGIKLQFPLFLWNASLAIFSAMGTIALFPEIIDEARTKGFKYMSCNPDIFSDRKKAGFWVCLYTWSKFWELGDTLFIVLRKRKLLFLHWYHHVTVLVVTWHAFISFIGVYSVFAFMNFFVHSFMYGYYALQARNVKIPRFISKTLTILQILQMVAGSILMLETMRLKFFTNSRCSASGTFVMFSLFIGYMSYLFLFLKFFYDAYMSPNQLQNKKSH